MDKIFLKNMEFFAYHGVFNDERINGQNFEIDLELTVDFGLAISSDNVNDTVDYSKIYEEVKEIVTKRRYQLIETLADRIISSLFNRNPEVSEICVRIRKPQAPIDGVLSGPEIEIRRPRNA